MASLQRLPRRALYSPILTSLNPPLPLSKQWIASRGGPVGVPQTPQERNIFGRKDALRHFSNTPIIKGKMDAKAGKMSTRGADMQTNLGGAQPSFAVQVKQKMSKTIPNDIGLIPGTLIMLSVANGKPTLWENPRYRIKMEFARAWKRIQDFISVMYFWKYVDTKKLKPKMNFHRMAPTAQALHRQMYTALAEGDKRTLNSICVEGLRADLFSRVNSRKSGEKYLWTLHSYTRSPRVVSHKATSIPIEDGAGRKSSLRQAVVRIDSRQSLQKYDKHGVLVEGTDKIQDFIEYIVIQKRICRDEEEDWLIWGTVEETPLKKLEAALHPEVAYAV